MENQEIGKKPLSEQQPVLQPPLQPISITKIGLPIPVIVGLIISGFVVSGIIFAIFSRSTIQSKASKPKIQQVPANFSSGSIIEVVSSPGIEVATKSAQAQEKPLPLLALTGILFGEQDSLALINGRVVREGGLIEGATLVKVSSDRVELSFEGKKIILRSK